MNDVTYQIATLLISLIGVLLTGLAVPWLKAKTTTQQLDMIKLWINIAVAAAEQMKGAGLLPDGQAKKEYVLKFIRDKGVTITDQELDALIEAAVYEINKAKHLLFKSIDMYDLKEHEE